MPKVSLPQGAKTIIYWKDNGSGGFDVNFVEHIGVLSTTEYSEILNAVSPVTPANPLMTDTLQTLVNNCDSKFKTENGVA